ncbi:MAG: WD40 repeat domain-containing protein, partial [Cyanobacteria bacterium P01_A01_bin.83]
DNVPIQHLDDFKEKNPHFCNELIFSHDNKLLISENVSSGREDNVFVHRVSDGKLLQYIPWSDANHTKTDLKLSPNSKFIAMSYRVRDANSSIIMFPTFDVPIGLFGHIDFWYVSDSGYNFWVNLPVATIRAHWLRINKIAFSPDGKWLASMSDSKDHNRVRLWRMPPYSGWWWFLGSIALVVWVFRYKNELQEWINR